MILEDSCTETTPTAASTYHSRPRGWSLAQPSCVPGRNDGTARNYDSPPSNMLTVQKFLELQEFSWRTNCLLLVCNVDVTWVAFFFLLFLDLSGPFHSFFLSSAIFSDIIAFYSSHVSCPINSEDSLDVFFFHVLESYLAWKSDLDELPSRR